MGLRPVGSKRRGTVRSDSNLVVLNEGSGYTFRRGNTESVIGVTLASAGTASRATEWKLLVDLTLSDHQYIVFGIETRERNRNQKSSATMTITAACNAAMLKHKRPLLE